MNQARWDLLLPFLFVIAYSFAMVWFGYAEGKRSAQENAEKIANRHRRRAARDKLVYDWARDGF